MYKGYPSYSLVKNTKCGIDGVNTYTTLSEAKLQCNLDESCEGFYHNPGNSQFYKCNSPITQETVEIVYDGNGNVSPRPTIYVKSG